MRIRGGTLIQSIHGLLGSPAQASRRLLPNSCCHHVFKRTTCHYVTGQSLHAIVSNQRFSVGSCCLQIWCSVSVIYKLIVISRSACCWAHWHPYLSPWSLFNGTTGQIKDRWETKTLFIWRYLCTNPFHDCLSLQFSNNVVSKSLTIQPSHLLQSLHQYTIALKANFLS